MALNEKKFYQALENIFVGAPIEGEGGYVNLLSIKQRYYRNVIEKFKEAIVSDPIIDDSFKEDFYNLLYSFFEKYFSECGSVYFVKTANWQKVYEKVYTDNKDVVLFWKTHMLYYVKSDMLFQSVYVTVKENEDEQYVFYFDVGELQHKQNNEKKELIFSYKETRTGKIANVHNDKTGDKTFVLSVNNSGNRKKTDYKTLVKSTGLNGTTIDKAINTFKKQTTVDFFINRNAKTFLEEQLDLFLHQLMLEEENVFEQTRLMQIKAVKNYAKIIIEFISQFENELVRIWNKPKFVKNSNYIISLDKLNDELKERIRNHKGLANQIEEWIKLGIVDEEFTFNALELTRYPHLPIDTKYFKDLELDILAQFENLSKELNGVLIHSENYQALHTIKSRYNCSVKCIYIDPPFNTGGDFDYLDGYQDSTWLSIIEDRIKESYPLLSKDGGIYVHLDRYANYYARLLLNNIYGKENYKAELYWDTCGNTGFKNSKNNWYQNTNSILQFAKSADNYSFNKMYTLLNIHDPQKAKEERKTQGIGWLDLQKDEGEEKAFVQKYDSNGVLTKYYVETESKVDPIGMIWTDILSFLYTQVGDNESYFFKGGQKPEHLLARIIQAQTKPNDLVMDFFTGIGTTVAVAHKLSRKYIGIEMGDHFNTFYDNDTRVGVLGRIKNVINGDSTFYVLNPDKEEKSKRTPQLTRNLNWQGGGFVKYYELEQYEDTLHKSVYSADIDSLYAENSFSQYIFFADKKLTDILDVSKANFEVNFEKLYENIDLPETISLLYGEPIEKITEDEIKLTNVTNPIKYNVQKMDNEEKIEFVKMLKPLLWWGE